WSHAPISRACAIDGISRRLTSTLYPAGASSLISPSNRILPSQLLCILLRCRLLFIPLVPLLFKIALLYGLLPRALKQSLAIWRIDDNPRILMGEVLFLGHHSAIVRAHDSITWTNYFNADNLFRRRPRRPPHPIRHCLCLVFREFCRLDLALLLVRIIASFESCRKAGLLVGNKSH